MQRQDRLYLDHAATTPILPEAREAMGRAMDIWANPSSPHAEGRRAKAMLEDARARIAAALGWTGAIIFTSGASEAIAIALRQAHGGPRLIAAVEHDAVRAAAPDAAVIPVLPSGHADGAWIAAMLGQAGERAVVAVQHVNSETGVIQPIDSIGDAVHGAGGLLFADCAQSAGRLPLPAADMIAVSAHKLGGPPGIGALLVRDLAMLSPVGGQERGYRRGTENLPGVMALAAALEAQGPIRDSIPEWVHEQSENRAFLDGMIACEGGTVICGSSRRSPLVATYAMPGMSSAGQLVRFDMAGIAVSAGSACSSGTMKPSQILAALGIDGALSANVVRVSFGRSTTRADVERFAGEWRTLAIEAQAKAQA